MSGSGGADATPLDPSEWWVNLVRETPELLVLYIVALIAGWWVLAFIPPFSGINYKINAWTRGLIHMFTSRESKMSSTDKPHPGQLEQNPAIQEKEFYFIRHGESEWNEIFNRNKLMLLPKLIIAAIYETLFFGSKRYSLFLDSPLCKTGVKQADELRANLDSSDPQQRKALEVLRKKVLTEGSPPREVDSVIFSSNLRRCIETAIIALEPRLIDNPRETVKIFSCLQECAPNVDTLALSDKLTVPDCRGPKGSPQFRKDIKDGGRIDPQFNLGSKRWYERSIKRMDTFLKFAFAQREKRIIVSGHSFYFRELFKKYMDENEAIAQGAESNAVKARKLKIRNCGVVKLVIQKGAPGSTTASLFRIKPDSIEVIHPCPEPEEKKKKGFVK